MSKLLFLSIIGIFFIVVIIYIYQNRNIYKPKKKFSNLSKLPLESYFANDIYLVPGQAKLGHNSYTSDYLPYESSIPAIDVLRANGQLQQIPQYLKQYLTQNTTPYSQRK